jgi:hypothetical protein
MAVTTTLLSVRTQVRQRTHYETSKFLDDTTELNVWINEAYRELYDLLVAQFQGSFYYSTQDFTIASGNTFSVPADFYHLTGIDWIITAPDQLQTLRRVMFGERNAGRQGYDLRGNTVTLLPYNWPAGKTFRLYYVPAPASLVIDGDTFDGVNGFEEYVVVDTCIKVCAKSGEDAGIFGAQKAAMIERIAAMASQRDEGEPAHVQDVNQQGVYSSIIGGRFIWDGVW